MLAPNDPTPATALEGARSDGSLQTLVKVATSWPKMIDVWGELGRASQAGGETLAAYAYFRVGYHRGLDALRAQGWSGSGYVRWSHRTNLGFLRCLRGLELCATEIGETDEAQRCSVFLAQLDPSGIPAGE